MPAGPDVGEIPTTLVSITKYVRASVRSPERIDARVDGSRRYPEGQIPPWWVGVLVMLGYGLPTGVIGTLILPRRDVS